MRNSNSGGMTLPCLGTNRLKVHARKIYLHPRFNFAALERRGMFHAYARHERQQSHAAVQHTRDI
jgi:hypothetical protein